MHNYTGKWWIFLVLILICNISIHPQDFWKRCKGLYEGVIASIWIDNEGMILTGTNGYGISISTNEGITWNLHEIGLGHTSLQVYFVNRTNRTNYLFAGVNDGFLYYSTNNGANWSQSSGWGSTANGIAEDSLGHLYVSTEIYGIYKSTNGGSAWFPVFHFFGVPSLLTIEISHQNNFLYAGAYYRGIFRSTNLGQSWNRVDTTFPLNSYCTSISFLNNGDILAAVNGGLFLSNDNGLTWNEKLSNSNSVKRVKVLPDNDIIVLCSNNRILKSSDLGQNWISVIDPSRLQSPVYSINYRRKSDSTYIIYMGSGEGLFALEDEILSVIGTLRVPIYELESNYFGKPQVLTKKGILISDSQGEDWRYLCRKDFLTAYKFFVVKDDTTFFASDNDSPPLWIGISRTRNGGQSWEKIHYGITSHVSCAMYSRNGTLFVGTYYAGIFRSTNEGTNWISQDYGMEDNLVRFITEDYDHIYASNLRLYSSSDNGWNWRNISPDSSQVISMDFNSSSCIYAGTNAGRIYKSSNQGLNWEIVLDGIYQIGEVKKIVIPDSGSFKDYVFAVTELTGIIMSSDHGITWNDANAGIFGNLNYKMTEDRKGTLYVSTNDEGLYRSKKIVSGFHQNDNQNTFLYTVHQNYPNPFNPSTKIKFTIPTSPFNPSPYHGEGNWERLVTLKVYDVLGRDVATLVNEEKPAGSYEVEFDAKGLSSGIYFYQLKVYPAEGGAGNFTSTRKMLLLR